MQELELTEHIILHPNGKPLLKRSFSHINIPPQFSNDYACLLCSANCDGALPR